MPKRPCRCRWPRSNASTRRVISASTGVSRLGKADSSANSKPPPAPPPASPAAAARRQRPCSSAIGASGSSPGSRRNSKSKVQSFGTMLSAVPPWIDAGMRSSNGWRRSRHRTGPRRAMRCGHRASDRTMSSAAIFDGVDALRAPARNGIRSRAHGSESSLPLMTDTELHSVGSPMMQAGRTAGRRAAAISRRTPTAADLLVIGEGEMDRRCAARAPRSSGSNDNMRRGSPSCPRRRGRTAGRRVGEHGKGSLANPGRRPGRHRCARRA